MPNPAAKWLTPACNQLGWGVRGVVKCRVGCPAKELSVPDLLFPPSYRLSYKQPNTVPHKTARECVYGVCQYNNELGAKGERLSQGS